MQPVDAPGAAAAGRSFFARPTIEVARALVGMRIRVGAAADIVDAIVVEVEAYLGEDDPASHAFRGPTPRAGIMFDEPGHLYVYLSYGVHCCANIVCEPRGRAGAVLLRSAAVISGESVVRRRRERDGVPPPVSNALLRGPGNLAAGLGWSRVDNGLDLCEPGSAVQLFEAESPPLVAGPRVGISRAVEARLRFAWAGHPAISAARSGLRPL